MRALALSLSFTIVACGSSAGDGVGSGEGEDRTEAGATGGTSGTGGSSAVGGAAAVGGHSAIGGASGTGGHSATGGASGAGGSGATGGASGTCDDLAPVGTFENVTPAELASSNWCVPGYCQAGGKDTYGAVAFVLERSHSGTIVLGTASLGIWKSTDCGSSWVHINTGTNGAALDAGRNWSMVIDPTDSSVIYTVTGYAGPGFYKTTDGGQNWQQMFPADLMAKFPAPGIERLSMDPTNHLHLTATFHGTCQNAPSAACMAETRDGGGTFTLTKSAFSWSEGDGQAMVGDKTWFYGQVDQGVWRTIDGGASWSQVHAGFGWASGCIYTATDGTLYTGNGFGMMSSKDGVTWTTMSGSPAFGGPNGGCPIADDGETIWVGSWGLADDRGTFSAPLKNPTTWTNMNSPKVVTGAGWLDYDADHHVLYKANSTGGFWRVRVK
jgi:hypothetical protein